MTGEPLDGPTEPATVEQWRPAIRFVRLLAGRWTVAVLTERLERGRRYQDLHDALDGISYKVLTEALRRAERDGLVARHLDGGRIETATLYELTDFGRSLDVPLAAMAKWAECTSSKRPAADGTGCGGQAASRRSLPLIRVRPRTSRYGVSR
jgi:DNA-binding HxlR family transcriptional regulator